MDLISKLKAAAESADRLSDRRKDIRLLMTATGFEVAGRRIDSFGAVTHSSTHALTWEQIAAGLNPLHQAVHAVNDALS